VLIGTIREPPEITSRGSHVEVSKYEADEDSIVATYRRARPGAGGDPPGASYRLERASACPDRVRPAGGRVLVYVDPRTTVVAANP
jgi:hypothetical protein